MPDARGLECWTLIDNHRLFDFLILYKKTCHGTDCEFDTLFLLSINSDDNTVRPKSNHLFQMAVF